MSCARDTSHGILTYSGDQIADRRWIALWCDAAVNFMRKGIERPLSGAFTLMTAIGIKRPVSTQFVPFERMCRWGRDWPKADIRDLFAETVAAGATRARREALSNS